MILTQDMKKVMNKKFPLVSVLINNYNKENFCVKAVQSIINQNYKELEIIFYDDNSSDSSINKIKELKKKKKIKRLKIIENKIRKNIFSFNQIDGIKKSLLISKGEIIFLLDSDDFFKKNKIKKIVTKFKRNKSYEILFDKPLYYYDNDNIKKNRRHYSIRNNKWPNFPPTSCISFKKKSLVNVLNKLCIKKYKELWFDFRIATYFAIKKKKFELINEDLTYYRQNLFNYDKKFVKFLNIEWWNRRNQAFEFLKYLDEESYKKNIYTIDFILTKLVKKIISLKF